MHYSANQKTAQSSLSIKQQSQSLGFFFENQLPYQFFDWNAVNFIYQNYYLPTQYACQQKTDDNPQSSQERAQRTFQDWDITQLKMLKELYENHGPRWAFLRTKFQNKNQVSIKNKFRNGIRSAARILHYYEGKTKRNKRTITNSLLTIMLNFVYQLQTIIESLNLTINPQNLIYKFRTEIIDLSLKIRQFSHQQLIALIKLIKTINSKIRCFGIFKINNLKDWKIKKKNLQAVCQFFEIVQKDRVWDDLMKERDIDISLNEDLVKLQEIEEEQNTQNKEKRENKNLEKVDKKEPKMEENNQFKYYFNLYRQKMNA